jgi:acyl-CoA synthetase (AMP-forming)/AMP-acid ligase II
VPRSATGSGHFYRGIGVNVLEGYGLTETTAALTANLPDAQKVGTVGRPLPGTAVRVAEDGELMFRGGQVFAGYWQDEAATAEARGARRLVPHRRRRRGRRRGLRADHRAQRRRSW